MAIHTGEAEFRDKQTYGGQAVIRCARLRDHARGGQVLVSAATAEVAADRLPPEPTLVSVGETALRGLPRTERVCQLVHHGLAASVAELAAPGRRLGTWPTPLIGRVKERQELEGLLNEARLVTITGTGGAGKTRLAHAVATELTGRGADVTWVELARISSDPDWRRPSLAPAALEAPGVEPLDVLVAFLNSRSPCSWWTGVCRTGPRLQCPVATVPPDRPGQVPWGWSRAARDALMGVVGGRHG
jgi:hypothetical protein